MECKHISGEIEHKEIQNYARVSAEEFDQYDITQADRPIVNFIRNELTENFEEYRGKK